MKKLQIRQKVLLKELTTFQVGGYARYFVEVGNERDLIEAVNFAKSKKIPIFVLGGGSDILVSDFGFPGLVLKYKDTKVSFEKRGNHVLVTAGAGMVWDDLVRISVGKELQGIECLSGIPGSVGASPIQNIGAYGQELKDTFVELTAYHLDKGKFVSLSKKECQFGYRESMFKKSKNRGKHIITRLTLRLNKGSKPSIFYDSIKSYFKEKGIKDPTLRQVRDAILILRGLKLEDPKIVGNAGSFFKNPVIDRNEAQALLRKYPDIPYFQQKKDKVKLFAGWLIEKAGWKGKHLGNVMVSSKNALVITNPEGKASALEIRKVADKIALDVYKKFKVKLEPEVQYVEFR